MRRVSDGSKLLKVHTYELPITAVREVAEREASVQVLALHAIRKCAQLAQQGMDDEFKKSQYY